MKYGLFSTSTNPVPRLGVLDATWPGERPPSLQHLIDQGPEAWERVRQLAASPGRPAATPPGEIRWHAPLGRPRRNVFCLGLNYQAHAKESSQARGREFKLPTVPVIFTKATTTVCGPTDDVPVDRGYTVINDVSARDLQQQHMQWFKGKSLDGFCPMGPVVITADEFGDPQAKRLQLRVNGTTKQDASTADMIFPVDVIIEWLSKGLTLEAGDIIATGTPEGVGMGRTPQEFLADGDVVEAEVEGIGVIRNRIRDVNR
jgi:2-keto-4-pentenoate hydratase/2-oxohepta-3-ene-1,7-dioic acid hydratase in catechol pathway